jgi:ankyrin repeat protein
MTPAKAESGNKGFRWSAGRVTWSGGVLLCLVLKVGASSIAGADEIHKAVFKGDFDRVVALLKDHPELVDEKDKLGQTPLIVAVNHNKIEIAELLLANGANVNARGPHMQTPLILAMSVYNHDKMVRLLLAKGADVNLEDERSMTAVVYAVTKGQLEDVKVLLANDADINFVSGETPLFLAVMGMRRDMVELLLANGADPNQKVGGVTPSRFADSAPKIKALIEKYGGHE